MAGSADHCLNQNSEGLNPWERRQETGIPRALLKTVKAVLGRPSEFFENLTIGKSMAEPFLFYLILAWPLQCVSLLYQNIFHLQKTVNLPLPMELLLKIVGMPILFYMGAAVAHLFVIIFRGKLGFNGTLTVMAYSSASTGLLALVPVLGSIVGGIWNAVIIVIGYKRVHGFSTARAVLAYLGIIFISVLILWAATAIHRF